MNLRACFVSGQMLERGDLEGIKLLILPSALYMTERETKQLDAYVKSGGVVVSEAHLASYNGTTGRYSRRTPGGGLADSWNIRETFSTSTFHLKVDQAGAMLSNLADDERKALNDSGAIGGEYVPVRLSKGQIAWGASRYAILDAPGEESLGNFDGHNPTIICRKIGKARRDLHAPPTPAKAPSATPPAYARFSTSPPPARASRARCPLNRTTTCTSTLSNKTASLNSSSFGTAPTRSRASN